MSRPSSCLWSVALSAAVAAASCGADDARRATPTTAGASSGASTTTPASAAGRGPEGVALRLVPVAELAQPVALAVRAGEDALYVAEKGGRLRVVRGGAVDPTPVLDLSGEVSKGAEQGLLGVAFAPAGTHVYVNYTDRAGDTRVVEYAVPDGRADPSSRRELLVVDQPFANHNGGQLTFGPDGLLYVGLGDGGSGNDPMDNAQRLDTLLGKLLRIDPRPSASQPYTVPPGNPFAGRAGARPEIWAYGLRNPWRFSFDRATGDLYIGDVGQNRYEWVHYQAGSSGGGQNYGWPIVEGPACLNEERCDRSRLTAPVAFYSHEAGCAVSGGYVYRGTRAPTLIGHYLLGDVCSGRIWTVRQVEGRWEMQERLRIDVQISSFGEDAAGEVYVVDVRGQVYRITAKSR